MSRKLVILFLAALLALILVSVVLAAPQAFDLSWWTVDGGGGTSSGGEFALSGTIGQPEVGYQMTGGDYSLAGGYWGGGALLAQNQLYRPIVTR